MASKRIRRGHIHYFDIPDLDPPGREMRNTGIDAAGPRRWLVVSTETNEGVLVAIPFTRTTSGKHERFEVPVDPAKDVHKEPGIQGNWTISVLACSHLRVIDVRRAGQRLGVAKPELLARVEGVLGRLLSIG